MRFEWDPKKDQANIQKHGIGFDQAVRLFNEPYLILEEQRRDHGELRYTAIGRIGAILTIALVFTYRSETIRVISARPASRKERALYEHALR